MKNLALNLLVLVIPAFVLISCNEDINPPDNTDQTKTKTELLCASEWKYIIGTVLPGVNINGEVVTDLRSKSPSCFLDNFVTYYPDSTAVYDEGPTKCSGSDPQTEEYIWYFNTQETTLTEEWGNAETYTIEKLTEDTLILSQSHEGTQIGGGTPGVTHVITLTYVH